MPDPDKERKYTWPDLVEMARVGVAWWCIDWAIRLAPVSLRRELVRAIEPVNQWSLTKLKDPPL